ncbi:hypothetical protein ACFPGO_02295 [Arcanobacterium canis]|uniref:N-acetyltransferase domain-containing protein n=1 Tax=Arcanobacterium canis TaxID=999183 RepID=A0ABY8FXE9_9ACTO|nr:hypothetical protein [Arcanobacterium canis]WFM83200.1 hypothetical protein P7079_07355 [Arcanobacterium canis]
MKLGKYILSEISSEHFIDDFDCGYDENRLGLWLRKSAYEENQKHLSRVWILASGEQPGVPLGYFSLSEHQLLSNEVLKRQRDGISHNRSHPARLLGKFALDQRDQGKGLGVILMAGVFRAYLEANKYSASRFLVLHTQHERLTEYYRQFGFVVVESNHASMETMILPTSDIEGYVNEIQVRSQEP